MRPASVPLAVFEILENRRLLSAALVDGVLVIVGTDADDYISVSHDATTVHVNDNGVLSTFARDSVLSVSMSGLAGNDTLQVIDDEGTFFAPVHSDGGAGDDFIDGAAGDDVLIGGEGNDYIFGYGGNDTVHAGAGIDFVAGMGGNDVLNGDDGNDMLFGGAGEDDLFGGAGADSMDGGEGADRYIDPDELDTMVMDGSDVIYLTPPPPVEEPCDHPGNGHHYGHYKNGKACCADGTFAMGKQR